MTSTAAEGSAARLVWHFEWAEKGWAVPVTAPSREAPDPPTRFLPHVTGAMPFSSPGRGLTGPFLWRPTEASPWGDQGYQDFVAQSWNGDPFELPGELASRVWVVTEQAPGSCTLTIRPQRITPAVGEPPPGGTGTAARWVDPDTGTAHDLAHVRGDDVGWVGGMFVTDPAQGLTWRYGYFEARFRYQAARGGFPAVWLFANHCDDRTDGYESAEYDLFESFGDEPSEDGTVEAHASWHTKPVPGTSGTIARWRLDQHWHRLGLDWTESRMALYYDGELLGEAPPQTVSWFQGANLGWRVTMAVNPSWPGAPRSTPSSPSPALEIDYLRVWDARCRSRFPRGRATR